ncbi:MAG TPA: aminotransferase class V-fold PLP-dependent enzyme, partial [Salinivirgaceae bacterium]|nr:aminotransferase class V-fold PLP-dependent enzyme [Salinivirgaceae bacterium]
MIPLYKPFMPSLPELDQILHSGQLAYGKYGREFENSLRNFLGVENLIVTNTFNMSILVALTTLGLKPGDRVIASPMACLASTMPLLSLGLKVIWADVDPQLGTLDPDSVRSIIKKNPKVIIHNHFCGYPGHIDEINSIGKEYGIPVIDDGIEAFGSEYKGKKIGNVNTDITIFSFNPVRIPNTLDGGAVIFKDRSLHEKSILVRDAGIDRAKFRDELGEINPKCDINLIGHSATPMELASYIGVQQMNHVDRIIDIQRKNALRWQEVLIPFPEIIPIGNSVALPNFWVFGILVPEKREYLLKFRKKGFYASGVHINNNSYSVFGTSKKLPGVT